MSSFETIPGHIPSSPPESPVVISSHVSLSQAVQERRSEYVRMKKVKIKIGTWNVAAFSGTEKDIGEWFLQGKGLSEELSGITLGKNGAETDGGSLHVESVVAQESRSSKKNSTTPLNDKGHLSGGDEIGIYALGLQEIVDITSAAEALKPFTDPNPAKRWKRVVTEKLAGRYHLVAEQQLLGLYLLIFASNSLSSAISNVSTASVGTGFMGYVGNKGGVSARIILGEATSIVFVNCHLSAGAEKGSLERRNWDAAQIQSRTRFEPASGGDGGPEGARNAIGDEDVAFWFGDLNYRLEDMPPEDVRRLLMLHTKDVYEATGPSKLRIEDEVFKNRSISSPDVYSSSARPRESPGSAIEKKTETSDGTPNPSTVSSSKTDVDSLQMTLDSLLAHDQLLNQMRSRKAFSNGWREGPIEFLPTYKYDVGSVGAFDSSEKRRGPSWCDRILYRTGRDKTEYDRIIQEKELSKKKDEELRARGIEEVAKDEAVLFDYDPEVDGAEYAESEPSACEDPDLSGVPDGDRLLLEWYMSHQRVLSSDHKPLDAVFSLEYEAVDQELRAKVHQEVARDLDKAENESRPSVTIVIDHHTGKEAASSDSDTKYDAVDFGKVKYNCGYHRAATIANTGGVSATIELADRSIDGGNVGSVAPDWISVAFDRSEDSKTKDTAASSNYTLEPGDVLNLEIYLKVEGIELVRRLNRGEESLEDVLVLRVQNGRDYFLPVRAYWLPSVFGRTIESLVRVPDGGVRKLQQGKHEKTGDANNDDVKRSAPRELFRMTEAIESLNEKAIGEFEMTGGDRSKLGDEWPFSEAKAEDGALNSFKEKIRDALDSDILLESDLPSETTSLQRLEAIAQTLVVFLHSLEDGIITIPLWIDLERGMIEHEKTKAALNPEQERTWILDVLSSSPTHSVSFTFITFALSRVANEVAPLRNVAPTSPSQAFQEAFHEQVRAQDDAGARRKRVETAYAGIFADAMVRLPSSVPFTGKARKAAEARKRRIVEVFISGYS